MSSHLVTSPIIRFSAIFGGHLVFLCKTDFNPSSWGQKDIVISVGHIMYLKIIDFGVQTVQIETTSKIRLQLLKDSIYLKV